MYTKKKKQSKYGLLRLINDIYVNASGTYAEDDLGSELTIQTDSKGNKYVIDGHLIYVDELVGLSFNKQKFDGGYYIEHIDNNISNCDTANLRWVKVNSSNDDPTPANTVYFNRVTVSKAGTLTIDDERAITKDHDLDTDLDRVWVYETPKGMTFETDPYGPELWDIEEWMDKAGFIKGNKTKFNNPVVLHIDNDAANLAAGNLEWCEDDDPRYIKYSEIRKERQIVLIEKYNKGYSIPDTWPQR